MGRLLPAAFDARDWVAGAVTARISTRPMVTWTAGTAAFTCAGGENTGGRGVLGTMSGGRSFFGAAVDVIDGRLAWRQHVGGHTDVPNFRYFIPWADRQLGRVK